MNRIQALLANPHTTWAGIVVLLLQVAQIWTPTDYAAKLDKTSLLVLSYGSLMAVDSKKKPTDTPDNEKPTNT